MCFMSGVSGNSVKENEGEGRRVCAWMGYERGRRSPPSSSRMDPGPGSGVGRTNRSGVILERGVGGSER